jgi:enoyl-CoA hydratase/carnithine racemase
VATISSQPGVVTRITLDRPDARNAVSRAILEELGVALEEAAADPDCRVVLLAGTGSHFCAGADIGDLSESSSAAAFERSFAEVLTAIADHPVPVVARVQGAALGAGCQLAVACDLAVAATDARIGIPSAKLGIVIGFENIQRLVLAVGPKRASHILFTGRHVDGATAEAWGLVNEAVEPERLEERAEELAAEIAEAAPLSVRGSKLALGVVRRRLAAGSSDRGDLGDVDAAVTAAFASEDLREGIASFRERRPPRFEGR